MLRTSRTVTKKRRQNQKGAGRSTNSPIVDAFQRNRPLQYAVVSLIAPYRMAMFVTQDTFDEVVKENMEDFGMDRQSAAEDAVGQFKAQGA